MAAVPACCRCTALSRRRVVFPSCATARSSARWDAAAGPARRMVRLARPAWPRSSRLRLARENQGRGGSVAALSIWSVPPVADQRLPLAPDQDQDRAKDTEHQPGRRSENVDRKELPGCGAGIALSQGFFFKQKTAYEITR